MGMSVTLIDQVDDKKELWKKELYWINKLNTSAQVGINVRDVYGNVKNKINGGIHGVGESDDNTLWDGKYVSTRIYF